MAFIYNCYGEDITGKKPLLADSSFGNYDEDMNPHPFWQPEDESVDSYGFDKRHVEENGSYIQEVILPRGTMLCRYGPPQGRMTTNAGIPYELLGLPYKKETIAYHEYKVIADGVIVQCKVLRGFVYPTFGSKGNVVQYLHPVTIEEEIYLGKIEEDFIWLKKKKISV